MGDPKCLHNPKLNKDRNWHCKPVYLGTPNLVQRMFNKSQMDWWINDKNIYQNYVCDFSQYQISKVQKRINHDDPANSYCNFHNLILFIMNFQTVLSISPFLFNWLHLKVDTVHSSDSSLFCKRLIICQLNVPATAAENQEQYTLSNIIYFGFQNYYSFHWSFFW